MGLPGTPPLLSSLTSSPVASPGLKFWGLWKHLQVSWFLHLQAIVWEPSISFNSGSRLLPWSKLERRMVQSLRFGPDQKEAWLAKVGAAVQLQRLRQTPLPLAPTPDGFGNRRKRQALLSFFPANADTLWLYLSKGFPFPFLGSHQGPTRPFHHKGSWEERVCPVSPWEEQVRNTGDPVPR